MKRINIRRLIAVWLTVLMLAALLAAGACTGGSKKAYPQTNIAPPALAAQPEIKDSGEPVEFTVNRTLSSHMVVQRNAYFNVYGTSDNPGGILYAEFMGEKRYGKVGKDGKWLIQFSSHEATTEPQTLKIYPKNGKTVEFDDILVGDVWMISGQSNAELALAYCLDKTPRFRFEINEEDNIRIFFQSRNTVVDSMDTVDVSVPQEDVISADWHWARTSLDTASIFSALGYYFAKELSRKIDVPLGVIHAAAGGATLNELMPTELAAELGFTAGPAVPNGGFYNTLVYPFTRNKITGMIYYQGESESQGGQYVNYARNLVRTVEAYRDAWQLEFPFINVQLSTHMPECVTFWPELNRIRAAQFDAYRQIPNSYIVTAMDQARNVEDNDWAHPLYKLELGKRAAKIAALVIYGQGSEEYSLAPEPDTVTWNADNSITVTFKHVGDGLTLLDGDEIRGLYACDEYGDKINSEVRLIDGKTAHIVPSREPFAVCYGMRLDGSLAEANLGSSEGLPMPAFMIEIEK